MSSLNSSFGKSTRAALPGIVTSRAAPRFRGSALVASNAALREHLLRSGNSWCGRSDEDLSPERTGDASHS